MYLRVLLVCSALLAVPGMAADPPGDIRELKLRDWQPRSAR